jgi:hypothetical protein
LSKNKSITEPAQYASIIIAIIDPEINLLHTKIHGTKKKNVQNKLSSRAITL